MTEKKIVVENLRLAYNGPFDMKEFYAYVDKWIDTNGMEKELKKKSEHVHKNGRQIEWLIEIWKNPAHHAKEVVRLRALFNKVKNIDNKKAGNIGQCMCVIDGILETEYDHRWEQNPMFYFFRAIIDKFVYKFHTNKFEGSLTAGCYKLHRALYEFFDKYKNI